MRYRIISKWTEGTVPQPGDLFRIAGKTTAYMALHTRHVSGQPCTPGFDRTHIPAVALSSGCVYWLPVETNQRAGFILLEPVDGELQLQRKED